jgi:tRNA dimethylallyltransferase
VGEHVRAAHRPHRPHGRGKTALALEVAERVGGEIISVDSRQVYRGMDVGTAKATAEERGRVPHHGLDLVDPDSRYSAGRFARDARRWIADIRAAAGSPS